MTTAALTLPGFSALVHASQVAMAQCIRYDGHGWPWRASLAPAPWPAWRFWDRFEFAISRAHPTGHNFDVSYATSMWPGARIINR